MVGGGQQVSIEGGLQQVQYKVSVLGSKRVCIVWETGITQG